MSWIWQCCLPFIYWFTLRRITRTSGQMHPCYTSSINNDWKVHVVSCDMPINTYRRKACISGRNLPLKGFLGMGVRIIYQDRSWDSFSPVMSETMRQIFQMILFGGSSSAYPVCCKLLLLHDINVFFNKTMYVNKHLHFLLCYRFFYGFFMTNLWTWKTYF
jgi:hypothetical protein